VVGIDSHLEISFNFGQRPFAHDPSMLPQAILHPPAIRKTTSPLRQLATVFAR
jgi:hypothetical protein